MNGLTAEQLIGAAEVLLTLFGAAAVADRFAEILGKWRTPGREVRNTLGSATRKLEEHEKAIRTLQEGQRALCAGVMALLDHELHKGSRQQMAGARDDISSYLSALIARP